MCLTISSCPGLVTCCQCVKGKMEVCHCGVPGESQEVGEEGDWDVIV